MSHLPFSEDSWVAFLVAFPSWLSLLSRSTSRFCGNLQKKNLLRVISRPALSNPLSVRSAVSGCRGLQVTLVRTAEARVAQVGCCPLHHPLTQQGLAGTYPGPPYWLHPSEATASACPGTWGRALSLSCLRDVPVKAFNLQNLSPTMHSLLLIHITCVRPLSWRVSFLLGGDELMWTLTWHSSKFQKPWETLSSCSQAVKCLFTGLKLFS